MPPNIDAHDDAMLGDLLHTAYPNIANIAQITMGGKVSLKTKIKQYKELFHDIYVHNSISIIQLSRLGTIHG